MIFCTVGTQVPFDRFLQVIDNIAPDLDEEIVVQCFRDKYKPKNIKVVQMIPPDEFGRIFNEARLIISHAGIGTIVSALTRDKPIIIFPRVAALGEHRNEHQQATAKKMREHGFVHVAHDEVELRALLQKELKSLHKLDKTVSQSLIEDLEAVIG